MKCLLRKLRDNRPKFQLYTYLTVISLLIPNISWHCVMCLMLPMVWDSDPDTWNSSVIFSQQPWMDHLFRLPLKCAIIGKNNASGSQSLACRSLLLASIKEKTLVILLLYTLSHLDYAPLSQFLCTSLFPLAIFITTM